MEGVFPLCSTDRNIMIIDPLTHNGNMHEVVDWQGAASQGLGSFQI